MVAQMNGESVSGTQGILELGCYCTAWTWIQNLRVSVVSSRETFNRWNKS